jgi:hypothetical protein
MRNKFISNFELKFRKLNLTFIFIYLNIYIYKIHYIKFYYFI